MLARLAGNELTRQALTEALSAGRLPSRLCEYVYDLTACQPSAAAGAVSQPRLHVCPYCGRSFTS